MDIIQFRQQYPQYDGVNDETLTNRLYEKHYRDKIPFEDFRARFLDVPGRIQPRVQDEPAFTEREQPAAAVDAQIGQEDAQTGQVNPEGFSPGNVPSDDVTNLAARSVARLGATVALPRMAIEKAQEVGGRLAGAGPEESQELAADVLPVVPAMRAFEESAARHEKEAVAALSPKVRRAIELNLVERDEQGDLRMGEGAADPWWWTAQIIDMGAQMAPGVGSAAMTARMAYRAKMAQTLTALAAEKIPQSVAVKAAQDAGIKAATRAAVIAGGISEGGVAAGMSAQQIEQQLNELDEETLMNYEPYRALRDQGLDHEVARARVATDRALGTGLAVAAVTGMTGAPLNAFIARWATRAAPTGTRLATAAKGAALEGGQEFVQEGSQQALQNVAEQPITGKSTWDGVLENAITGGVLGFTLGGAGGLAAGGEAPAVEQKPADKAVATAYAAYDQARRNRAATEEAVKDPAAPVRQDQVVAAREAEQVELVKLSQALLASGRLKGRQQKVVAQALQEARAAGVEVAETTITPEVAPERRNVEAAKLPKEAEGVHEQALNANETQRLDVLNRMATADIIEAPEVEALVAAGLAKWNQEGRPLLTPAGRRQRVALTKRAATVEADEVKAAAAEKKAEAKPVVEKPQVAKSPVVVKKTQSRFGGRASPTAIARFKATGEATAKEVSDADLIHALGKRKKRGELGLENVPRYNKLRHRLRDSVSGRLSKKDREEALQMAALPPDVAPKQQVAKTPQEKTPGAAAVKDETREKIRALRVQANEFAKTRGGNLTKDEAAKFIALNREADALDFDRGPAATTKESLAPIDQRKSTLSDDVYVAASTDVARSRSIFLAMKEHVHGAAFNADTPVDKIMRGADSEVSAQEFYDAFAPTRAALQKQYGDTITLYRAHGKQKEKPVSNWATTKEFAAQFGPNVVSKEVPTANVLAANVTRNGKYHELIVGQPPQKAPGAASVRAVPRERLTPVSTEEVAQRQARVNKAFARLRAESKPAKKGMLRFRHFTRATAPTLELDASRQGEGIAGAEARRAGEQVTSLYPEDLRDEDIEVGLRGLNEYRVEIPEADLYDASADPLNLSEQAQEPTTFTMSPAGKMVPAAYRFDMGKFEAAIRKAGFRGYRTPGAEGIMRGQARVFDKVTATRVADGTAAGAVNRARQLTGLGDSHTHALNPDGKTTPGMNGHVHTWKPGAERTSRDDGHDHPLGKSPVAFSVAPADRLTPKTGVGSAHFKKWFGKSKVVDAEGNPITVYHGTNQDITAFEPQGDTGYVGPGIYFTDDSVEGNEYAGGYRHPDFVFRMERRAQDILDAGLQPDRATAERQAAYELTTGNAIYSGYLKMENPLYMDDAGTLYFEGDTPGPGPKETNTQIDGQELDDVLKGLAAATNDRASADTLLRRAYTYLRQTGADVQNDPDVVVSASQLRRAIAATGDGELFSDIVRELGYDGIIHQNARFQSYGRHYVVFEPQQFKSIYNKGTWSPDVADMAASVADKRVIEDGGISHADLIGVAEEIEVELGVPVRTVARVDLMPDYVKQLAAGRQLQGAYFDLPSGGSEVWLVAENIGGAEEARATALHEIVGHMGLRGLAGRGYGALTDAIGESFPDEIQGVALRNNIDTSTLAGRRLAAEELVAYATEQVLSAGVGVKQSVWRKIVAMVRDWLRSAGLLTGYNTADIEALIYRQRDYVRSRPLAARKAEIEYNAEFDAAAEKGLIAREAAMTTNEFEEWFSGSKVVEKGRPKRVYHGTSRRFESFDVGPGTHRPVAFFTDHPGIASEYAGRETAMGNSSRMIPSYLSLKNPLIIDAEGARWTTIPGDRIMDALTKSEGSTFERLATKFEGGYFNTDNLADMVRMDGFYDGVIIKNVIDTVSSDSFDESTVYIAFRSDQIRSAIAPLDPVQDGPLLGMPRESKAPAFHDREMSFVRVRPNHAARRAAQLYKLNNRVATPEVRTYVKVDPKYGARVADAYENMAHAPNDPRVKAAYDAMIAETLAQYQEIKKTGLRIEFIREGRNPYLVPREAIEDVNDRNHLWVFPTDSGFGEDGPGAEYMQDNPMLEPTDEYVGQRQLLVNDVFRVVHDYFGHIQEGNGFRADGEENAWRIHSTMYSPLARAALTTETRGQNSWVNWGPHGEANRTAKQDRTKYAPQKIGLLPEEFWTANDPELAGRLPVAFRVKPASAAQREVQDTIRNLAGLLTPEERTSLNRATARKLVSLFESLPDAKELAAVARAGQAKRGWYQRSAKAILNVFGPDAPRFAALLAALSPQTSVEQNFKNAVATWANWVKAGRPIKRDEILKVMRASLFGGSNASPVGILPAWINNTVRALATETPENAKLSGPKVNSFAANLRGETNEVTLDTWMANFAAVDQSMFAGTLRPAYSEIDVKPGKGAGYLAFSARVRQAAQHLTKVSGEEWTPAEVQETIWSWAKALYEESEAMGAMGSAQDILNDEALTDELINATPDFATLFAGAEHQAVLRSAGYGANLDRAARSTRAAVGARREKTPAAQGDRARLMRAAERLDDLKAARNPPNPSGQASIAFSILGGNTGDPDLDAFMAKIGDRKRTLRQWWTDTTDGIVARAQMAVFDHLHGVKRAEDLAGISLADSGYVSMRLAGNAGELVQSMMEYGYPIWDDGAPNVAGGQGMVAILKPLGPNLNKWLAYMVARRADRLAGEGRENLFAPNEIAAALKLGKQHPEFDVVAKQYAAFQTKVLDFAQQAGIIDPDSRALWENQDYIPFYRLVENGAVGQVPYGGKGFGWVRNQIKQLRGGTANLGDPLENIVRNWLALMDASLKAHAARQVIDNLDGTGLVTKAPQVVMTQALVVKDDIRKFIANNAQLVQTLQSVGLDVNKLPPQAFIGLQKMLAVRAQTPQDEDVISVWRAGKREYWKIHDAMLYQSLQGLNAKSWGPLMEVLRYPKRLLTAGITLTPQFAAKNIFRDMWHAFVQGAQSDKKITIVPLLDTVRGAVSQIAMDRNAQSMLAGGGAFTKGYVHGADPGGAAAVVRRAAKRAKPGPGIVLDTPAKLGRFYTDMLSAAENAHRVAMYNRAIAAGKTRKEALYEARDMLDFSMRGNNAVVRFLVESVPFFNARLQGLYRLGRGFKANALGVGLRGMLITVASAALFARNHDDERYEELSDDQKNTYWHVFDIFEEGDHWKIPKPFEVGTIFGTVPEAILDAIVVNADEPDATLQALKLLSHAFGQTLNLSPEVQTVWPLVELAINQNTFTGSPILTQGDEGVLPEQQDSPRLSPTYRLLARAMPDVAPDALRSPKQLEHLGRGYLGNLQDYVLVATDSMARAAMDEPAPPARASQDLPGLRDFRTSGPSRHTKYLDALYKIADRATKVEGSIRRLEGQETDQADAAIDELEAENEQLLDVAKDFTKAADDVNELRKEQRQIQLDPDMTPDAKREELDAIQQEINEIARDLWDLRPGGKLNPDVSADLIGKTTAQQQQILDANGMPATARLLGNMETE